jgi:hypothetical protein
MTAHINRNPEAIARVLGDELPPLPNAPHRFAVQITNSGERMDYTAKDMREYALAAAAPYKARVTELLRSLEELRELRLKYKPYTDAFERAEKAEAEVAQHKARIKEWEEKAANWLASPEAAKQFAGYRELASRAKRAEAEVERLCSQLPAEMQECTIRFKECEKGHGWLTADNWIQHGCPTCEVAKLRELLREVSCRATLPDGMIERIRAALVEKP